MFAKNMSNSNMLASYLKGNVHCRNGSNDEHVGNDVMKFISGMTDNDIVSFGYDSLSIPCMLNSDVFHTNMTKQ